MNKAQTSANNDGTTFGPQLIGYLPGGPCRYEGFQHLAPVYMQASGVRFIEHTTIGYPADTPVELCDCGCAGQIGEATS